MRLSRRRADTRLEPTELDDVELDIVIAPAASTVGVLIRRLQRLGPAAVLVGQHRIVTATIEPDPPHRHAGPHDGAQDGGMLAINPPPDPDLRQIEAGPIPADRGGDQADSEPIPTNLGPPSVEEVALMIGRYSRRPVTAEQLQKGLRIAPDRSRDLREHVNTTLYGKAGDSDSDQPGD